MTGTLVYLIAAASSVVATAIFILRWRESRLIRFLGFYIAVASAFIVGFMMPRSWAVAKIPVLAGLCGLLGPYLAAQLVYVSARFLRNRNTADSAAFNPVDRQRLIESTQMPRNIFFAGWIAWFLEEAYKAVTHSYWKNAPVLPPGTMYGIIFGSVVMAGLGGWLAWDLYERDQRKVKVWFIIVCVILLWKFTIAEIVLYPSIYRRTLVDGIAMWWARATANPMAARSSFTHPLLLLISIFWWPRYCRQLSQNRAPVKNS